MRSFSLAAKAAASIDVCGSRNPNPNPNTNPNSNRLDYHYTVSMVGVLNFKVCTRHLFPESPPGSYSGGAWE